MRVMVLVKATERSEAGEMPGEELLAQMTAFNEDLVKAGVILAGEGLHPSSEGVRVAFSGGEREVIDGPFAATRELVAGYWLWQVESIGEAIEWVKRCPNPAEGESEIEIRPVFEADEFGESLTPELREREERLREQVAASQEIDARIEQLADWRGEALARIRRLIKQADPEVVEEIKWRKPSNPLGVPVWSHDGIICTGEPFKGKVKLTFAKGASLEDSAGLFNASLDARVRRAIDLQQGDEVDADAFKSLVRAAAALNASPGRD